jgi:hypothetical protein
LFQVFQSGLKEVKPEDVYSFVSFSGQLSPIGFSFYDMTATAWPLALLAGAAQFWQSWQMQHLIPTGKSDDVATIMNNFTKRKSLQNQSRSSRYDISNASKNACEINLFGTLTKIPSAGTIDTMSGLTSM